MSTLTNTQIQNTYQGLLKLANSTTGITTNFQAIEDGLGNDTGIKIATNYLAAPNNPGFLNLKADYYGVGFNAATVTPVASTQNVLMAYPFYDNGMYSYSAITYHIVTATTSSDVMQISFYTAQMVDGVGLAPHNQILSAQTLVTNSTGRQTTTLSSHLSFSGYGAGIYFMVMKLSNAGVTPTVRTYSVTANFTSGMFFNSFQQLGFALNASGNAFQSFQKNLGTNWGVVYSGLSTFNSSFTTGDVTTPSSNISVQPLQFGWVLNTVK